jgi:hypothetical protein
MAYLQLFVLACNTCQRGPLTKARSFGYLSFIHKSDRASGLSRISSELETISSDVFSRHGIASCDSGKPNSIRIVLRRFRYFRWCCLGAGGLLPCSSLGLSPAHAPAVITWFSERRSVLRHHGDLRAGLLLPGLVRALADPDCPDPLRHFFCASECDVLPLEATSCE